MTMAMIGGDGGGDGDVGMGHKIKPPGTAGFSPFQGSMLTHSHAGDDDAEEDQLRFAVSPPSFLLVHGTITAGHFSVH